MSTFIGYRMAFLALPLLLLASGCGWVRVVAPTPDLTPGRLASIPKDSFERPRNLDFESVDEEGVPKSWKLMGHGEVSSESGNVRSGERALRVKSSGGSRSSLVQCVDAQAYRGKKALLSGDLKSSGEARVSLRLRAIHPSRRGYALVRDEEERDSFYVGNVTDRTSSGAYGDTWWARYRTAIQVPKDASLVCYMLTFYGNGTSWADGLSLEVEE